MATTWAIGAVCETLVGLLRDTVPDQPAPPSLEFQVATHETLDAGVGAGITLFLYRIHVDGTERAPAGRETPDGRQQVPQLPVQLHLLLTMWGQEPSLQHYLAGHAMRVMADNPVLPAGLLNGRYDAGVAPFREDETVEVSPAALSSDELFQLWESLGGGGYRLSVPYQARGLRIESQRLLPDQLPVAERVRDYRLIGSSS